VTSSPGAATGPGPTAVNETPILEVRNLEVVYNDVIRVLHGISLSVPDGAIVALLGANGAGKTTTLRSISGLLGVHEGEVTKGSIQMNGIDITEANAADIVGMGVVQVLEGRRIFAELTVEENLRAGAFTVADKEVSSSAHGRVMELFPVLRERLNSIAGYLSGGEQQMLAIGRALMTEPRLLLLDEPSLGLAPLLVSRIRDIIVDINSQGTAVLLVEQNAAMALSIASHGYVIETGKVVMDDPAEKLLANDDVKEFYLGLHAGDGGERRSFREVKHYKRKKRWLS
jgi:branched-chain amino acid transport system ATP-binding protein